MEYLPVHEMWVRAFRNAVRAVIDKTNSCCGSISQLFINGLLGVINLRVASLIVPLTLSRTIVITVCETYVSAIPPNHQTD